MVNVIADFWEKAHKRKKCNPDASFFIKVICNDGFSMGVGAGKGRFSEPERFLGNGLFKTWEVAHPTGEHDRLLPYIARYRKVKVFGCYQYVPTEIINRIICDHGGIIDGGKK